MLMKNVVIGVALAALLSVTPAALAKDKSAKALKSQDAEQSSMDENANRGKNDDGTFQGKPVVQGPADWSGVHSSASAGSSSGEGGSSEMPRSGEQQN
jgi:hypothetical protein